MNSLIGPATLPGLDAALNFALVQVPAASFGWSLDGVDYVFERLTVAAVRLVRSVAWAVQQGTRRALMAAFLCCWLSTVLQLALVFYAGRAWLYAVAACVKLALAVAAGLPSVTASAAAALLATLSFGARLPLRTLTRVAAIMQ